MLGDILNLLREVNVYSITLRMILAILFGGLIGYDRSKKGRPAGFRTHILVCIGSALVMITNQYIVEEFGVNGDPARMGAQVISGIGFLGAGTILTTSKQQVKGLTTAAGLWASACMGLAIGIGFYEGALIGCITIFGSMTLLQRFDDYVLDSTQEIELYIELRSVKGISLVLNYLHQNNIEIMNIEILRTRILDDDVGIFILMKQNEKYEHHKLISSIGALEDVLLVEKVN